MCSSSPNCKNDKESTKKVVNENENQCPPKEEETTSTENAEPQKEKELTPQEQEKAEALKKEKEKLRAPFADLMNNYKKKIEGRQKTSASRITDITKSIFVDSYTLNYSTFFPGKMLGSTLNVGNMTNSE